MPRGSTTQKCCCDADVFYLLTPCEDQSSKCPENGVFVSECAWSYLSSTYIFLIQQLVIVIYSENCCLYGDTETPLIPYTYDEVIAIGGDIVYCKAEKPTVNIEDFPLEWLCDNVLCNSPPNGACCYDFRGGRECEDTTEAECFEDHEGDNPVYHGNGTCCTGLSNECEEGEEEIDCSDPPDDDPECHLKLGTCVYQDGGGTPITTNCGMTDDGDECPSSVSFSFNFPSLSVYVSSMPYISNCADADCGGGSISQCMQNLSIPNMVGSGVLTRSCFVDPDGGDQSGEGCWENVDDQADYNPTLTPYSSLDNQGNVIPAPPHQKWTYGGSFGTGLWVVFNCVSPSCFPSYCANPSGSQCSSCEHVPNPNTDWSHCWGLQGWHCPFCCGKRLVNWWWQATLRKQSGSSDSCLNCNQNPPCSCWKLDIRITIGTTECLDNTPQGSGLGCNGAVYGNPDLDCDQHPNADCCIPLGGETVWINHTISPALTYYLVKDGCTCPDDGLSNYDAHLIRGFTGTSNQEKCYGACGCDKWMYTVGDGRIKTDSVINGTSWNVS